MPGRPRTTSSQWREEVEQTGDGEYEALGEYRASNRNTAIRHRICGTEYEVLPSNWRSGTRCPTCNPGRRPARTTPGEWRAEVAQSGEYRAVDDFVSVKHRVRVHHLICGTTYDLLPQNWRRAGARCPVCGKAKGRQKRSPEGVRGYSTNSWCTEVSTTSKGEYETLGEYVNARTPTRVRHITCGHEYDVRPMDWRIGKRCPACNRPKHRWTTDDWRAEVHDDSDGEYEATGDFAGVNERTTVRHLSCDYVYEVTPNTWRAGSRCPRCANPRANYTTEDWRREVKELVDDEYEVLGDYSGVLSPTLIRHLVCGHEYEAVPARFFAGNRCPRCFQPHSSWTTANWHEEVHADSHGEYEAMGEYRGSHTHTRIRHVACGIEYDVAPGNWRNGKRCRVCAPSGSDFDAVYLWMALDLAEENRIVVKVGLTSRRIGDARVRKVARDQGFKLKVLRLANIESSRAIQLETELLAIGHPFVDLPHESGRTEFRAVTGDELDRMIALIDEAAEEMS